MVFHEQLTAAHENLDPWETLLVWRFALLELITVALPLRLSDSLTIATVGSLSFTPLFFGTMTWAITNSRALNAWTMRLFGF